MNDDDEWNYYPDLWVFILVIATAILLAPLFHQLFGAYITPNG